LTPVFMVKSSFQYIMQDQKKGSSPKTVDGLYLRHGS